ncbi:MAG: heme exporter protein CcmD [Paracoccaceae bacterium]|jgi:heme exporter protein D|nr:heme exporter protein CcmD [Paracoccaceae bacterium]MDH5530581.1 heme exporter protein CcmD [Paracoccaceae bacterium]
MVELGKYAGTVLGAYGVALGLILGLVWLTLWQGKRMRRRLEATERELGIDG